MIDKKLSFIKKKVEEFNYIFLEESLNESSVINIYNLFKHDQITKPTNSCEMLYYGFYYYVLKKNNDIAKKFYLQALEQGNVHAIRNLTTIYEEEGDDKNVKKHFLMGINLTDIEQEKSILFRDLSLYYKKKKNFEKFILYCSNAIELNPVYAKYLAWYYESKENKYKLAKIYYKMAINAGDNGSMNQLGLLYNNEQKYQSAEKYFLMAINQNNYNAMLNLAFYYFNIVKDINLSKYYYIMAANTDNRAFPSLEKFYKKQHMYEDLFKHYHFKSIIISDKEFVETIIAMLNKEVSVETLEILCGIDLSTKKVPFWLLMLQKLLKQQFGIIDLHFEYLPDAKGAQEAKHNFLMRLNST